jgi:hypothetical protein
VTHACYIAIIAVLASFWYIDCRRLERRLIEAECKFEAIDPIRAEAGVPMSDKCECFWKGLTLEQIREMK